jgi:hypothetical protein
MPGYRTLSISELKPGSVLVTPVFDNHNAKLLDAGTSIDQHLIDRLEALGITEVTVDDTAKSIAKRPSAQVPSGIQVQLKGAGKRTTAIDRCSSCGTFISLQPPTPNTKATTWLCKQCGAIYFGSEDFGAQFQGVSPGESSGQNPFVAPVEIRIDSASQTIPPENVQRLIKSLVPNDDYTGPDRRRHKRYPVTVPAIALPLAIDFRIAGEPVKVTTANVSFGGAALIHTRFVDAPYLALDFTVAGVELLQVVLKVLRVRSVGPVYEVAGEFVSRLSQAPT